MADVSPLTIGRIGLCQPCRPDTFRKIILELSYTKADKERLLPDISVFVPNEIPVISRPGFRSFSPSNHFLT